LQGFCVAFVYVVLSCCMRKIYCISGLGADQRFFDRLDIPGHELVALPWVPYDKYDDMASYAAKIIAPVQEQDAIIIGLSFGGMLAVEAAKMHPSWRIFLVSSAKTKRELGYDKGTSLLVWLIKNSVVPAFVFNRPNPVIFARMGAVTAEDKKLVTAVFNDSDAVFMRWCVQRLIDWENNMVPTNVTHIHGTNDQVIASANVHPDYWIAGGTHMMIYDRAGEVSKIISDCLGK